MRLHRFYVPASASLLAEKNTFDIADKELVHQWKKVFRYNVGSQVVLFDGSGTDSLCMITSLRNLGATVSVLKQHEAGLKARRGLWLCAALIKKDNFEWVVQKATELGATHIVPVLCEHSEKKKIKLDRAEKIAIEATEQSGRGDVPVIHPIATLKEIFDSGVLPQEKIVCHPGGISFDQYKASTSSATIAVFVGPEGGFSDKEMAFFKSYNVPSVSLGSLVLRAETAAIAAASLLLI